MTKINPSKDQIKEKIIFLKGKKTILRPLDKETDLQKCVKWINDPEIRQFLLISLPISAVQEEEWFDNLKNRKNNILFAIETLDGKFIGTMGLHNINWESRTATTGTLIGEKEYWGKGFGTDAKMVLLSYAFNILNLHKINSSALAYNNRSIHYNMHCGYKIEGIRKRQFFKKGKYWDEVILGVFKKDWATIWKKYRKTGKVK